MKKIILPLVIVLAVAALFAFNSKDKAPARTESYATVAYSTAGKSVFIYYGGTEKEEIKIEKEDNVNNKILDALHALNEKGYELMSTNSHAFNRADVSGSSSSYIRTANVDYIELYYTLRKKN